MEEVWESLTPPGFTSVLPEMICSANWLAWSDALVGALNRPLVVVAVELEEVAAEDQGATGALACSAVVAEPAVSVPACPVFTCR